MASISFLAGSDTVIQNLSGSGLGFYSSGFGASVEVGKFQGVTFITDGNGVIQGNMVDNCTWINSMSGIINSATSGILLTQIPNYLSTLNIRFTHSSAVKTQNAKLRIYDRSNINNAASGVTTKVAEIIHPGETQSNTGSGDIFWLTPAGSAVIMDLTSSPGVSGQYINGASTSATQHDFYTVISCSPDSVGSKLFGCYISLEYLTLLFTCGLSYMLM